MSGDSRRYARIRKSVIDWYNQHGRDFPWRHTVEPYPILIAEILLRRTTASAVSRVYPDFINRFDTPECLATTRQSTIARALTSLGLQTIRAKQLKKMAMVIVHDHNGKIPRSHEELQSLPGVGRYIASAVRNFAFGERTPLVDGNVVHFFSRVFGVQFSGPTDEKAWEFAQRFGRPHESELYWGIIDHVGTVCLRRNPRCVSCTVSGMCHWFKDQ